MITVEKLEKGTYFDDAFKISFRYDPTTVAKVKELAERRYLPEDRAWEIPAHELPALIEKVGLSNIKSEEAVVQALNTKEIEDKREATQERLKGIKPVRDFDFKTAPLPHQIEAFNYGMEKNSLLIGDEQGLGKTKESIDICVARKKELIKTLIVCGVNSVKYNWEKEIQIHSNEGCVMVDGKTMDVRVQQLNDWYRGSSYFGVINIESLRNEKIQDALYLGIKDGYIGAIIVDEIHKAKNGGSQQGKALRFLKAPVKIGLSGTPMNKAEDLWNILTWLGVERRSFYSFRNAYCTMGGFGGYKVIGYKNLDIDYGRNKFPMVERIGVETVAYQKSLAQELRRLSLLPIININTSKDKVTRAMRRSANFENHKVYFREGMDDLEECLLLFPEVDHDDLFDALDFAMTMADGGNEIRVLKREDFRI